MPLSVEFLVLIQVDYINKCSVYLYFYELCRELGWQGLIDEVEMEVQRISARNLGRDDRYLLLYMYNVFIST